MDKRPTYEELEHRVRELKKRCLELESVKEELRDLEERYRALFGRSLHCIYLHDFEGRFIDANEAALSLLGYTREELTSLGFSSLLAEDLLPKAFEALEQIKHSGSQTEFSEYKLKKKDGDYVWVETDGSLIYREGNPYAILGVARDITDRKKADEALQQSEQRYRSLVDTAMDVVFSLSTEGIFQWLNPAFETITGWSRAEWLGKSFVTIIHPDDLNFAMELFQGVLGEEKAPIYELRILSKTGQYLTGQFTSNLQIQDGEIFGILGIARDISELKRVEDELKKSEEKYRKLYGESKKAEEVYRSLLHSSADAIVIYDLEGKAKYVSLAFTQIFGWTIEELSGKQIPFVPDSEKEATKARIKDIIEKEKAIQGFQTKRYTKDERTIDVSISASRYSDHEGKPAGVLVTLRDISERKKMEMQLHQAQKVEAIGTLAGGIAHDFNNLLMAIQGNTSLMLYNIDSFHPNYGALKNIEQQVRSGAKLTAQLLGYARKGKFEVKPISLKQLVEETGDTFGRTRKDITIHRELSEDLFAIEADQGQIEQVLLNLYVNAADAMPIGGDLTLKTVNATHEDMKKKPYDPKPGNYVLLTVTDTGIGMEEKIQKRIFDPFFTTKEMGRGTGLGLASVYGIIKGHGGYIDVQSEKGRGTTFSIYLPASNQKAYKEIEKDIQITGGTGTILLVDDEEMVLDVSAKMLKNLGYTVFTARSGNEAIETYEKNKDHIDMIILDMVMPQMGGGETYDRLKEIDPDVIVLLSSGYSIDGKAKGILSRGCEGFIQKPFGMEELVGKTREILANR